MMEVIGYGGSKCSFGVREKVPLPPPLQLHFSSSCVSALNSSFGLQTPPPLLSSSISSSSSSPWSLSSSPRKVFLAGSNRSRDDLTASSSAAAAGQPSLTLKKKAAEISPVLKGTSVFLVGINSSIKAHLGILLADALRYFYFDSDSLVEEAAGGKSSKLVFEKDEKGFRESESEVLKQLSSMGRLVVCAGNGAVQSPSNLALLRHGICIWIDVPLDMVAREVLEGQVQLGASEWTVSGLGSHFEVLTHLTRMYAKSESGYAAAADSTVSLLPEVASKLGYEELAEVSAEDMVLEVMKEIEKLTRVKQMMEAAARPF